VGTARQLRPKRLGEKLASIRRRLKLSQNEIIGRMGFAGVLFREEISSFERDVRVPPPLVLLEYARLAKTNVDNLLDDALEVGRSNERLNKSVGGPATRQASSGARKK